MSDITHGNGYPALAQELLRLDAEVAAMRAHEPAWTDHELLTELRMRSLESAPALARHVLRLREALEAARQYVGEVSYEHTHMTYGEWLVEGENIGEALDSYRGRAAIALQAIDAACAGDGGKE